MMLTARADSFASMQIGGEWRLVNDSSDGIRRVLSFCVLFLNLKGQSCFQGWLDGDGSFDWPLDANKHHTLRRNNQIPLTCSSAFSLRRISWFLFYCQNGTEVAKHSPIPLNLKLNLNIIKLKRGISDRLKWRSRYNDEYSWIYKLADD